MDTLQFHFHSSIFSCFKNKFFWDPKISWYNKYKNKDPLAGPRFPFSTTLFVGLTDGWHFFKLLRNLFIVIGIYSLININKNNKFIIFFILITSIIVLFTKERASFFLLVFGVMIYITFSNNISKKIKFLFSIAFFSLVFLISTNVNHIYTRMFLEIKDSFLSNNKIYFFSEGHTKHFITAYKIYEKNKIFGVGPNNFRKECKKNEYKIFDGCTTHAHNFYVQMLAEVGIVGLIFLIIFFITILSIFFKNINSGYNRYKEFQLCILIALLINFWPVTTSGNFFGSSLSNIYIIPFAFLMLRKIDLKIIK
jgi:O-antigen ligase